MTGKLQQRKIKQHVLLKFPKVLMLLHWQNSAFCKTDQHLKYLLIKYFHFHGDIFHGLSLNLWHYLMELSEQREICLTVILANIYSKKEQSPIFRASRLHLREHFQALWVQICLLGEHENEADTSLLIAEMQRHSTLPNTNLSERTQPPLTSLQTLTNDFPLLFISAISVSK